ncbi:hypothetical protein N658DRAFT_41148 [Parathielavia hyrcaniae]|uniref:Uncharacterized protein n=1 Tax=Parathielavia hyrcaniae TaxID=113614 RepID=A0AAN6Q1L3_9PEZI|nr:hypothetical protein N658DRAFT_41148 [Parathielavia hyrcaniae]
MRGSSKSSMLLCSLRATRSRPTRHRGSCCGVQTKNRRAETRVSPVNGQLTISVQVASIVPPLSGRIGCSESLTSCKALVSSNAQPQPLERLVTSMNPARLRHRTRPTFVSDGRVGGHVIFTLSQGGNAPSPAVPSPHISKEYWRSAQQGMMIKRGGLIGFFLWCTKISNGPQPQPEMTSIHPQH